MVCPAGKLEPSPSASFARQKRAQILVLYVWRNSKKEKLSGSCHVITVSAQYAAEPQRRLERVT